MLITIPFRQQLWQMHQGIFDYSFLTSIPNMSVMAPKNLWELRAMLDFAMDYNSPLAIRSPRGEAYRGLKAVSYTHLKL